MSVLKGLVKTEYLSLSGSGVRRFKLSPKN